jgi:hypothetical protein
VLPQHPFCFYWLRSRQVVSEAAIWSSNSTGKIPESPVRKYFLLSSENNKDLRMKLDWNKLRKQVGGFVTFYCAIFASSVIMKVIISGHSTVIISNGILIGPAIGGLIYILFSQMKKTQNPVGLGE